MAGLLATLLVFNTPRVRADERDEKIKQLEKRLESFEEKTRLLEEKLDGLEGRANAKRKTQPTLSIGQSGFTMHSAENDFVLSLHGIFQLDSRTYAANTPSPRSGFAARMLEHPVRCAAPRGKSPAPAC